MPCKDETVGYLAAALDSVLQQTSPHWRLLVLIDPDTPAAIRDQVAALRDERIRLVVSPGGGMAGALNAGMRVAESEYVCILLSDDALAPGAVATVARYVRRHPEVDFFYSSRRYLDGQGRLHGPVMRSARRFTLEHFSTRGSPVKHLLCWRREKGLKVGGMDERFSVHGCDDKDFPWTMAEAGARFLPIRECLYYYRNHQDRPRLTTHTPLPQQIDVLAAMLRKHRVPEAVASQYLRRALKDYLLADTTAAYRDGRPAPLTLSCYGEFTPDRLGDFLGRGYKQRHFFPHRVYALPKGGPDGLQLARRMCGVSDPSRLREIVLFASAPAVDALPESLYFDDDLVWHQQQFGRKGQVATASVVLDGKRLFATTYVSDLVQRISRRRQYKTRVEKVFQGWSRLLINALLVFALENGVETVLSASAALALKNTDPARSPDGRLFTRVYDDHLRGILDADRQGEWWRIDVRRNAPRAVLPEKRRELLDPGKVICICHDIERGLGHLGVNPAFARAVEGPARDALGVMLDVEEQAGIRCTYHVVGTLFNELRAPIAGRGHAVAFHSYDHGTSPRPRLRRVLGGLARLLRAVRPGPPDLASFQLQACRGFDYRIKGYRPPRSRLTRDISDAHLAMHNFEWLASSRESLRRTTPALENGIVKIPIHLDDFDLYRGRLTFDGWARLALELIRENDFTALSLHDCYAGWWLKEYAAFLRSIRGLGTFLTFDEVAAQVFLSQSL
jgi:hypothetical protein